MKREDRIMLACGKNFFGIGKPGSLLYLNIWFYLSPALKRFEIVFTQKIRKILEKILVNPIKGQLDSGRGRHLDG